MGAQRSQAAGGVRLQLRAPARANDEGGCSRLSTGGSPLIPTSAGSPTAGTKHLVLAQRYPADFDGIIAGAPANNWAPLAGLVGPWVAAANLERAGQADSDR